MVTTHFMDEAEHCDKVAFIYCGRLIADDTPEKLKKLIPGTLYEIESERGMELLAEIEAGALGGLIDSYFFGERLRVIVPGERSLCGEALLKKPKSSGSGLRWRMFFLTWCCESQRNSLRS